ncbi:MAG: hypothetical protein AAGA85_07345, partial [Bacteroidota bacterium]
MAEEQQETDRGKEELFPFQEHFLRSYWDRFTTSLFEDLPSEDTSEGPVPDERFEPSEPPASAAIDEEQASEAPTVEDPNGADPVEPLPPAQDRQPASSPPAVQLDAMLTDAKPPTKKKPA